MRQIESPAFLTRLSRWKAALVACALCAATPLRLPAQTFSSIHSFDGTDGAYPLAGLVQAADGNLYGTTQQGGANSNSSRCYPLTAACGTVFKITPGGTLSTIYNFCSQTDCTDGANPVDGLIQASDGNLYGTTYQGGSAGNGTVFRITPGGTLTTLHSFCLQTNCADGQAPEGGVVQAADGNLYGTTFSGGNDYCQALTGTDCGTVYKITLGGTFTVIHNFCMQYECADGANPAAGLMQGSDGNLYGTTELGGTYCGHDQQGCGTVFKVTRGGALTVLHVFDTTAGAFPVAALVQAADGNFYGTTSQGGSSPYCGAPFGCGTVFKITPSGTLTSLYSFCSLIQCRDGASPVAALVQATDGNLYGVAQSGGMTSQGALFKISLSGLLTTVFSFNGHDGWIASAPLTQDTNGKLYGTTAAGGVNHGCFDDTCGTVFALSANLQQFVAEQPTLGRVGMPVRILGTNLTGATSVTFNGTAATFKVVSPTLITTTVPAGATTGSVQVTTPHGVLTSNAAFTVLQ